MIDFLLKKFEENKGEEAIIFKETPYKYAWLLERISFWHHRIVAHQIKPGAVATLEADFSPDSVALLLALVEHRCVVVPLSQAVVSKKEEFIEIAQSEIIFRFSDARLEIKETGRKADHEYYLSLRAKNHPGLVLFSSGSTGKSKAAVHDLSKLLEKFKVPRYRWRTIAFLLFDHIGGINTMFYTLSNAGCLIVADDRTPDGVLRSIEKFRAQLLPTSPTFINLMILSEAYKRYDLSSLKIITYGTEPMPETTLRRINTILPHVTLQQTYGLTELGILRSKSKSTDSLWVRVGGEGVDTKVVDGVLWIRANSAMIGYLNADNPFDEEGWFCTGDLVDYEDGYTRILGRKSELINVGGQKVHPTEVENVILMMEGVEDVSVKGEPNPIVGQIVVAQVKISTEETVAEFKKRLAAFCKDKLARYKIPQKVSIVSSLSYGERFKKMR
ncbi:MAG: fatty acid--CoA ligase family protein [Clostridiales bacterium]|nr:fatty acid--CoA ligase family protein [Clostridiales bacterium]